MYYLHIALTVKHKQLHGDGNTNNECNKCSNTFNLKQKCTQFGYLYFTQYHNGGSRPIIKTNFD